MIRLRRSGGWSSVGRTAIAKMVVMVVSGLFGLVNTRLIISHFGADAYAQYGLLATFPTLMPFTDLGIGAVILNTVAGSADPAHDSQVRRTITTAIRVLLVSTVAISTVGIVIQLLGLWPALLGAKLMPGGGATATACLLIYAIALPASIGQRVVIGLGRSATQVISQGVVSPAMTCLLLAAIVARLDAGNAVSIYSYLANTLVSVICVVVAWRATRPLLAQAIRDVPRLRAVRGVKILNTAGPQLVQSLVIPIAFQTDRLLLSHLGRSEALAQYNLANTLFNLLTQTIVVTGVSMWPLFAKARADGRIESPFKPAVFFAAGGLVLALVLGALAPWAARLLSDGLIALPLILIGAYVLSVVVEAAKQPLGMYMTDPRGLQFQMVPVLVLVPMNLAVSWVLIEPFGAAGPILGSVISVVVCQLMPYSWWVARDVRRRRALAAQPQESRDHDAAGV
ncbi:oligosaccharide flippase family protein [Actinomyces oricola]|uniref:oligosaccharide flippase family protein n=1 Tax=Actinomyces oricola TaxID=206043 RepID=UPI000FFE5297|nr:oligosaccharide flippase family protein [Actinomyces oricola]